MKAEIRPLCSKYYGTIIDIFGEHETEIHLWCCADYIPSERELKQSGYTLEDWKNNIEIDDGWGGKMKIRDLDITCDCHFESQWTYELAQFICKAINKENAP